MTDTLTLPRFETGMKIRFGEEKSAYTVQAIAGDGRYLVCTKPFNLRKTVLYTVVDLAKGIRGTDNRVFDMGYKTPEECHDAAAAFAATDTYAALRAAGEHIDPTNPAWLANHPELVNRNGFAHPEGTQVSYRNWVWLRLADNQPDPRVADLVPALRALLAQAPERNYNDHNPRTTDELDYRP
ncbi:hypothetical protein [Mycolicibacterium llatzerense]|uniref:hypothetical protein n=1 Tax=Mycolicibacterium llatzerense TaxID=280871 RepID=UPI0021B4DB99|nr:hypothetical protein [Mycolicibacterium llatzerense]MCT7371886.1 hypothetical protein [Mycolicibacterium llatzerense]